ncbi:PilN domain-containing protein [Dokdonella sp. MW10]|uniref:PilN domain-containing protein n=1 Tax=Dokdonella sp. MW10 TaxID=2992926 RepID=UPI003F7F0CED
MNEALDRQLARLRTRLAKTPLPRFFAWWGGELLACLPEHWRKRLAGRSEALLLEVRERELVVWRERAGGTVEFGRISLDDVPEAQLDAFRRLRARIENPNARTVLVIPGARALTRAMTLPAAAEDNLRQVLAFEMDRQTPFKADQVYFDSRVASRDAGARNMRLELVVMPRTSLDPELAAFANGTAELDAVDIWRGAPGEGRHHINLLPSERRARRRDMRLPLNLGLAAAALALLVFNMSESLANRAAAVEAMSAAVDQARAAATEVTELRKTLQDSIGGANFLSDKKRKGPVVIGLLNDLTHRLKDDTYLERLQIENNQIQIQGQSKEAANLISVLASSPYLGSPRFEGQIQPDPRTSKDRFTISADPRPVDIGHAADTPAAPGGAAVEGGKDAADAAKKDAGAASATDDSAKKAADPAVDARAQKEAADGAR